MDDTRINELIDIFKELAELAGGYEETKIMPNLEVIDASPADLPANFIIISDDEGFYVPAVKAAGLTVSNGDFVNVLYIKGTEPIAFQHGSNSGGGSSGISIWPDTSQILLHGIDYASLTLAIAAAAAQDEIYIGQQNLAEVVDVNKQLLLRGVGSLYTVITRKITVSGNSVELRDLTVATVSDAEGVEVTGSAVILRDCSITGSGAADQKGLYISGTGYATLYDTSISSSGSGNQYGLYNASDAAATVVYGGSISGITADVYTNTDCITTLQGPVLAHGTFAGPGIVRGYFYDSSGNLYTIANGKVTLGNGSTTPPLNITERSAAPSAPATNDIYLDDGTNTTSGNPGFRRYTGAAWEDVGGAAATVVFPVKNRLYHSMTYNLWQEGTSFTHIADDTYFADLWNIVHNASGGFEPNITQITTTGGGAIDNALAWSRITGQEAGKLAGIVQFLENKDTVPLRDKVVSLSFEASGSGVTALRAAVLSWSSTADSLTSDVVGTWGTGNPTLATNWAYANTPAASIDISGGFPTRYVVENIAIPDGANNLAVFIWTPATFNSNDYFEVRNVQLEIGEIATDFVARYFSDESSRVRRFVQGFYNPSSYWSRPAFRQGADIIRWKMGLTQEMRSTPSLSHNVTAWDNDGVPETTELAAMNWSTYASTTITGSLTGPLAAEGDANDLGCYISSSTSFDGTAGDLCDIRFGPDVKIIALARL